MNKHIQSALAELKSANAIGLPSVAEVEKAPAGKRWYGKKKGDDRAWHLTKNGEDSLSCEC